MKSFPVRRSEGEYVLCPQVLAQTRFFRVFVFLGDFVAFFVANF
jgi:hypothetical protein